MEGEDVSQSSISNSEDSQHQQQQAESGVRIRSAPILHLPLTRVKSIIKSDPDITLASHDAVIAIAKATELFVGLLSREAHVYTVQGKRKTLQRRDVDACIPTRDEFAFLEGALDS